MVAASDRFLSIVEVFPPSFQADEKGEPVLGLEQKARDFVQRVKRIESLADAILIADVKDTSRIKLSTVQAAVLLKEKLGVEAIPVITARDSNRQSVTTSILAALSQDITSLMLVWGDRYGEGAGVKNVYDYGSLSELVAHARKLAGRAGVRCSIYAPVDLTSLEEPRGVRLARSRLREGSDFLLAQPPTVDTASTLRGHEAALTKMGIKDRVLPNVFPFRDAADIASCRKRFGWSIPDTMFEVARRGEAELLKEAHRVVGRLIERGFPGVYVSTRGRPEVARFILD